MNSVEWPLAFFASPIRDRQRTPFNIGVFPFISRDKCASIPLSARLMSWGKRSSIETGGEGTRWSINDPKVLESNAQRSISSRKAVFTRRGSVFQDSSRFRTGTGTPLKILRGWTAIRWLCIKQMMVYYACIRIKCRRLPCACIQCLSRLLFSPCF